MLLAQGLDKRNRFNILSKLAKEQLAALDKLDLVKSIKNKVQRLL